METSGAAEKLTGEKAGVLLSWPERLALPLFFLSGMCGLMYEILWVRMLNIVFGVTVYAVTAVLCSFMAGLALGSVMLGRRADRSKRPLVVYGLLEVGVAVFALAFPWILSEMKPLFAFIHRQYFGNYDLFCILRFVLIFPVLLVPTFLMGGSLPFICRFFTRRNPTLGRDVGMLYAINTFGAVAGTFLVGFVLLARFGIRESAFIAVAINLFVGFAAIAIGLSQPARAATETAPESAPSAPAAFSNPAQTPLILWVIALSGFASLGLQVLWTRLLVFYTHNSTYAFSSILMVFLVGLALGSWLFGLIASRIRRPMTLFAALEAGIGLWVFVSVLIIGRLHRLSEHIGNWLPWNNWHEVLVQIAAQVGVVVLPPTILMGMTVPLATRLVTRDVSGVGRGVGIVYGANTLGTVVGSFAAGFILIPWLGIRSSLAILCALNAILAVALLLKSNELPRILRGSLIAALVAMPPVAFALIPSDIFARFFNDSIGKVLYYKEETTDTIAVVDLYYKGLDPVTRKPRDDMRFLLFGDGRGTAGHPTRWVNRYQGHLSMFLHPDPKDVLVICIGAGNTLSALVEHDAMRHLTCVDLSPGVVEASAYFESNNGVLNEPRDPRIEVLVEDGRNFLEYTDRKFDVIQLEPPLLHTAGVVFLYTEEFYEACRKRLNPGGIIINWVGTWTLTEQEFRQVTAAFQAVFPEGTIWTNPSMWDVLFVASDGPLRIPMRKTLDAWNGNPGIVPQLKEDSMDDLAIFLSHLVLNTEGMRSFVGDAKPITDDHTMVDFSNPRQDKSGFGYYDFLAPHKRSDFLARPSKRKPQDVAALQKLRELHQNADSVLDLIDWTGVSDEERQDLTARMRCAEEKRRAYARDVPPRSAHTFVIAREPR